MPYGILRHTSHDTIIMHAKKSSRYEHDLNNSTPLIFKYQIYGVTQDEPYHVILYHDTSSIRTGVYEHSKQIVGVPDNLLAVTSPQDSLKYSTVSTARI